jgi:hypothetical protein
MKELGKLFEHTLMDIYYAENQILKALPKLAQKAKSPELKKAFEAHLTQTEDHVKRSPAFSKRAMKSLRNSETALRLTRASSPRPRQSSTMKWPVTGRSGLGLKSLG